MKDGNFDYRTYIATIIKKSKPFHELKRGVRFYVRAFLSHDVISGIFGIFFASTTF